MSAGSYSNPPPSGGSDGHGSYDQSQFANSGFRKMPPNAGYDAGDGFQFVEPQLNNGRTRSNPSSPVDDETRYRRRSSFNNRNDKWDRSSYSRDVPPAYERRYSSSGGAVRHRSHDDLTRRRYVESESSDDDFEDDKRGGPVRKLRRRLSNLGEPGQRDGEGNTPSKKWGATIAGALVGATAARQARRDNWVPTALGAVIGGMTAREAEKAYFRHKERRTERDSWDDRRGSDSRSHSRPRFH